MKSPLDLKRASTLMIRPSGSEVNRMKLKERVVDAVKAQFGHPAGLGGRAAGLVMAHRSSNRRRNSWAVSLLDVQPDDRVLEIGFGPGIAILELSRIAHECDVCGLDHSELMFRRARRRNADGVRRGVVDLRVGSVDALPAFDAPFERSWRSTRTCSGVSRTRASSSSAGYCVRVA
jgi:SAM-dependent methyltransferase